MNGRLYDPVVGRFLSPDIVIQNPASTQNYNRYSYCLNNPLRYTDPSGYEYLMRTFNPHTNGQAEGGPSRFKKEGTSNGDITSDGYYYDSGQYYYGFGTPVSYEEVHNNYILPNGISPNSPEFRLYTHISSTLGYQTGTMVDGFNYNGRLYEFSNPISISTLYATNSGGSNGLNIASNFNTLAGYGTDGVLFLLAAQEGSRRAAVLPSVNGRANFYINSNKYLNKLSVIGKGAGYTFFGIGATLSVVQFGLNPTWGQGAKSTADIIAGYGALTPAAPLSLIYFGIDIGFAGNGKSGWENVIDANVQHQIRIQEFQSGMTPFGRGLHNGLMNWY